MKNIQNWEKFNEMKEDSKEWAILAQKVNWVEEATTEFEIHDKFYVNDLHEHEEEPDDWNVIGADQEYVVEVHWNGGFVTFASEDDEDTIIFKASWQLDNLEQFMKDIEMKIK